MRMHKKKRRRHFGHGPGGWERFFGEGPRNEEGQGPFGWRRRFFEPGEMRLALLSLLKDEPIHGYELMRRLEERSGGLYKASAGSVYPNLQQLENEGLIRAKESEGKRVFTLTSEGETDLEREAEAVGRIWSRASDWSDWADLAEPNAVDLVPTAMRLVRSAVNATRGPEGDAMRVRKVLEDAIAELES
jgi:DNA-binding PadR family transcriptional regulator